MYLGGVSLGGDNHDVAVPAVGDEGLAAVEDEVVTIGHRHSADASHIGTSLLGEG